MANLNEIKQMEEDLKQKMEKNLKQLEEPRIAKHYHAFLPPSPEDMEKQLREIIEKRNTQDAESCAYHESVANTPAPPVEETFMVIEEHGRPYRTTTDIETTDMVIKEHGRPYTTTSAAAATSSRDVNLVLAALKSFKNNFDAEMLLAKQMISSTTATRRK